jgi:hypothetical protein
VIAVIKLNTLVKVATVTSSVLLVTTFIAYRGGAFSKLLGNSSQSGPMGGTKSYHFFTADAPSHQPKSGSTDPNPSVMGGSKSSFIIDPPRRKTSTQPSSAAQASNPSP